MITAWIGYAMLCAAVIGACAAGLDHLLALARLPRRPLWLASMTASFILPLAASWVSRAPVRPATPAVVAASASTAPRIGPAVDLDVLVLVAWALATISIAAWLVVARIHLWRSLARCPRSAVDGENVIVSPNFGPAIVGVLHPRIVVPAWMLAAREADRRIVFAHEREHLHARDPLCQVAGLALAVAAPWNLAVWWQLKRLRLAIEIDCDSRVVQRERLDPVVYGELLFRSHASVSSAPGSALALVHPRSALGQRVDALLGLRRASPGRIAEMVVAGVAFAGIVAFVPVPPIRRASTVSEATAATTRSKAVVASVISDTVAATTRRSSSTTRARRRTVPAIVMPPVRVTPSGESVIASASSPTIAPLPTRRFGTATIAPRAAAGFVGAATAGGVAARGGAFAAAVRRDTSGGVVATGATAGDSTTPRAAVAGRVVRAGAKPPLR